LEGVGKCKFRRMCSVAHRKNKILVVFGTFIFCIAGALLVAHWVSALARLRAERGLCPQVYGVRVRRPNTISPGADVVAHACARMPEGMPDRMSE